MNRIAAMPDAPPQRFRCLQQFDAAGRRRRRVVFRSIGTIRAMWDQVDARDVPPSGSSLLQRLRARTARLDRRRSLLSAIAYIAVTARIKALETKAKRRRDGGSAGRSST
jgi:hypothetical protein